MLKISKKVSYIMSGILIFMSLLVGILVQMKYIDAGVLGLCIFGVSSLIYILYLFVPIKRKSAYLYGFITSVIINTVAVLPFYVNATNSQYKMSIEYGVPMQSNAAFINMVIIIIVFTLSEALFGGFVYLVDFCVRKLGGKIKKK